MQARGSRAYEARADLLAPLWKIESANFGQQDSAKWENLSRRLQEALFRMKTLGQATPLPIGSIETRLRSMHKPKQNINNEDLWHLHVVDRGAQTKVP